MQIVIFFAWHCVFLTSLATDHIYCHGRKAAVCVVIFSKVSSVPNLFIPHHQESIASGCSPVVESIRDVESVSSFGTASPNRGPRG